MGDDHNKSKETADAGDKNKRESSRDKSKRESSGDKNKRESSGRNKDRDKNKNGSCYSGSYLSWSSGDSSGNSAESDDDKHQNRKKKPSKNTKRERTKRGKVSKARGRSTKQMDKKRKKQTRRLADDVYMEGPSKALSICTVMSKASTRASSRSAYSNDGYASEGNQKKFSKLGRDERRYCVNMLLKKMRAARNSSKRTIAINDEDNDKNSDERMDDDEGDDEENEH